MGSRNRAGRRASPRGWRRRPGVGQSHRPAAHACGPASARASASRALGSGSPAENSRPIAAPVSLDIPAIGVQTRLVHLGLTAAGALQVPPTAAVAGWYTGSPRPGAIGAAVIAGHIDSAQGPGVFFRLRLLRAGELVYIRRAGGSLAVFRVTAVRQYPKTAFPTSAVYGAVPTAQLRLITCGGTFREAGWRDCVLLGMGGSSLCPEVCALLRQRRGTADTARARHNGSARDHACDRCDSIPRKRGTSSRASRERRSRRFPTWRTSGC